MSIITETKHYAACPDCGGKLGTIDHLASDEVRLVGPWYCDGCGRGWMARTNGRDVCEVEPGPTERRVPATVTLVLPPQSEPVVLTLHARTFEGLEGYSSSYYYDEHTCPTNWMRDVVEVRIGNDADPHGLFRFEKIEHGHLLKYDNATGKRVRVSSPEMKS